MARPTKLTPKTHATIIKAIGLGATFEAAANAGGVSYDTFNEWRKTGDAAEKPDKFSKFSEAVKKAIGDRQARWLSYIEKAASEGTWQAAAWKIERTDPENFGRQRVQIEHSGGVEVKIIKGVSFDDL